MNKRKLGNSGGEAAPLAFGGNVFGWTVDEPTAFRLLDAFVGAGFNLIDTADMYPKWVPGNKGGESETIIGNWLKQSGKRKEVVIATKVGAEMAPGIVKKYLNDRGFRILQALDEAAKQHHSTPAKISLAWLIARPSVTAPIASATSLEQLNDLIEATSLRLDHSTLESLNRASAYSAAAG